MKQFILCIIDLKPRIFKPSCDGIEFILHFNDQCACLLVPPKDKIVIRKIGKLAYVKERGYINSIKDGTKDRTLDYTPRKVNQ